jgi:hypothetical protein
MLQVLKVDMRRDSCRVRGSAVLQGPKGRRCCGAPRILRRPCRPQPSACRGLRRSNMSVSAHTGAHSLAGAELFVLAVGYTAYQVGVDAYVSRLSVAQAAAAPSRCLCVGGQPPGQV